MKNARRHFDGFKSFGGATWAALSNRLVRDAAQIAGFWLLAGLITYFGLSAVVKIQTTGTRLFLVVVVLGVAFSAASLLAHLLRYGEPVDEGWPHWYAQFNKPTLHRSSDDAPYSYVVLPRPMAVPKLLTKDWARRIAANVAKLPELLGKTSA